MNYSEAYAKNTGMHSQPVAKKWVNPFHKIHKSILSFVFIFVVVTMIANLAIYLYSTGSAIVDWFKEENDKFKSEILVGIARLVLIDILIIVGAIILHMLGKLFGRR